MADLPSRDVESITRGITLGPSGEPFFGDVNSDSERLVHDQHAIDVLNDLLTQSGGTPALAITFMQESSGPQDLDLITPATGKKLRITNAYAASNSSSAKIRVELKFITSAKLVLVAYPQKQPGGTQPNLSSIVGQANEPLHLKITDISGTELVFLVVNYLEVT